VRISLEIAEVVADTCLLEVVEGSLGFVASVGTGVARRHLPGRIPGAIDADGYVVLAARMKVALAQLW
jgi:hypothetical protein